MKIGVTGSRSGPTLEQEATFRKILGKHATCVKSLHHGCCVGGDATAHHLARLFDIKIVGHPPVNKRYIAALPFRAHDLLLDPKPYLERNKDIVKSCDLLLGLPKSYTEEPRSGTWATIRAGKASSAIVLVIYPDGSIQPLY